ncbi:MAG TPA: ABC transporter permease [Vicinamibacterales bacterium]|nr:ABC transporter permease [Vicinamibacterales bacterium]
MGMWLDDFRRDIGYALRTLGKVPAFTLVAVLTLALGISAVTVIYSVLRNVVLDPFPYSRSDRMVNVLLKDASDRIVRGPYFPASEFLDYQEQTTVFEDVVGTSVDGMHWVSGAGAQRLAIAWMTPNGFDFLGVQPALGRVFGAADAAPGAPRVAVMNHRAWMTIFGADPGVVGRTLMLDGEAFTVIGVMPPRFEWNIADLWLPDALERSDDPKSSRGFRAFQAHLRPGVTPSEAEAQLEVVAARRASEHPDDYPPNFRFQVITVIDWVVREFRGVLYTLFGAVSLLLVIACCNVANMLLARATIREREIGIRAAIGASRARIVRQLLVESALLAFGGLVLGSVLAYVGIEALAGFMPRQGVPWETEIRLDRPVLVFAVVAAAVATLGFGLFPAVQSARRDLVAGLNIAGKTTVGRRQTRMRSGLVIVQVALSIVLLLGAGLLMRSFVRLVRVDLGFDPTRLLVAGMAFPPHQSTSPDEQQSFYREALERVGSIPGARSAAISRGTPPFGGMTSPLQIPGLALPPQSSAVVVFSSAGLLDTLGVRLIEGRGLSALDVERAHHVAIVNETLATRYFGAGETLGRTIRLPRLSTLPVPVADPVFEIIGVARDTANQGPRERPGPQVFIPYPLQGPGPLTLVLRTSDEPMRAVDALRREIQHLNPGVALIQPSALDDLIQRGFFARPRFSLLVLGIFAGTGIVLVALGVYGVLAYTVTQQTREIAIRLALGSERGHVIRMVLRFGLRLVGAGVMIGVAASLATNRLLQNQLWNISPFDPLTFTTAIGVVVAIGLLACWVPARRAVHIEPMVALRHE